ncbi:MAG: phenylalanine--tRNA ligase subunit beta [Desulfurococcaceae archaeon]
MNKSDLEELLGVKLVLEDIYKLFTRLKCEIESIEGDFIIYEANTDRPDLFSVEGVSRAIKPWLNLEWRSYRLQESIIKGYAKSIPERPYVALAVVRDLHLNSEAISQVMQLQEKITQTHGRGRRKISIGVYDLDYIEPPIYYDTADPYTTRIRPLNEEIEMTLREVLEKNEKGVLFGYIIKDMSKYPILRDANYNILSLAPIINSDHCKITSSTKNVLIDATGTSLEDVVNAVTIMATSIAERSRSGLIEIVEVFYEDGKVVKAPRTEPSSITLDIEKINNLLGTSLKYEDIRRLLKYFYYIVEQTDNAIIVKSPIYRVDVKTWVDVAEDIAVAIGYDVLGAEADHLPPSYSKGAIHPIEYISNRVREIAIGLGFQEVANYMMSSRSIQLDMLSSSHDIFLVENPRTERFEGLRTWLTPQLLEVVIDNSSKHLRMMIFEIGDIAALDLVRETRARIERRIGLALTHEKATLTDGLAYTKKLLQELGIEPSFRKNPLPGFLPERTAIIKACGDIEIGFVGEIDPRILYNLGVKNPVIIAELYLSSIIEHCRII